MTMAIANVRITVIDWDDPRIRRSVATYSARPSANITGVVSMTVSSGSRSSSLHVVHVRNAARISNAPWATLTTPITPKISVRPDAARARIPPSSRPRAMVCTSCSTFLRRKACRRGRAAVGCSSCASASDVCEVQRREKQAWQGRREGAYQERTCPTENAARRSFFARRTLPTLLVEALVPPLGLWVDEGVTCGDLLGTHDLEAVALPLGEQELALWTSGLVPSEGAEDRLDLVVVQIVGQRLLIVDVPHLFHRSLQN